jgi:hypothetical protein
MTSEREFEPNKSQTWGYYTTLESSDERDGIGENWFNAGYIDTYYLNDEKSVKSLHTLLNSFNDQVKGSRERPFRLIIEPTRTHLEPGELDQNELIVLIEPNQDDTTLFELEEFTDKLRIK